MFESKVIELTFLSFLGMTEYSQMETVDQNQTEKLMSQCLLQKFESNVVANYVVYADLMCTRRLKCGRSEKHQKMI